MAISPENVFFFLPFLLFSDTAPHSHPLHHPLLHSPGSDFSALPSLITSHILCFPDSIPPPLQVLMLCLSLTPPPPPIIFPQVCLVFHPRLLHPHVAPRLFFSFSFLPPSVCPPNLLHFFHFPSCFTPVFIIHNRSLFHQAQAH